MRLFRTSYFDFKSLSCDLAFFSRSNFSKAKNRCHIAASMLSGFFLLNGDTKLHFFTYPNYNINPNHYIDFYLPLRSSTGAPTNEKSRRDFILDLYCSTPSSTESIFRIFLLTSCSLESILKSSRALGFTSWSTLLWQSYHR